MNGRPETLSLETPPPYWVFRSRPDDVEKTIVISGRPRGGTTFLASIVASLGFPFKGTKEQGVDGRPAVNSLRYEHSGFVTSWKEDRKKYAAIARELDAQFPVWAIKHPRATDDLAGAAAAFRNPHFLFVLKEPLSVAMRLTHLKNEEVSNPHVVNVAKKIMRTYAAVLEFCLSSQAPCMVVSYDMAMRAPESAIEGIAAFLGKEVEDLEKITATLRTDRHLYFDADAFHHWRESADWKRRALSFFAFRFFGER